MKKMTRVFILLSFLILNLSVVRSQIPGLSQFTTNNGLPSNTIYDIIQDKDGFIWFATDYGISKFDGSNYKNFNVSDGLPGNEILFFYRDSKNRIWISAFNGKIGFIKDGIFYSEQNAPYLKQLKYRDFTNDIFEDSNGNIWFYQSQELIKVLKPDLTIETISLENRDNLNLFHFLFVEDIHSSVQLITHVRNPEGPIILSHKLNKDGTIAEGWKEFDKNEFSNEMMTSIKENAGMILRNIDEDVANVYKSMKNERNHSLAKFKKINNHYWITNTNDGVFLYQHSSNFKTIKKILPGIRTTRAFLDSENNIWVGTVSKGVFFIPNLHIIGSKLNGAKRNNIESVNFFEDNILLGNELGQLLFLDPITLEIKQEKNIDIVSGNVKDITKINHKILILSHFNVHELSENFELKLIANSFTPPFSKIELVNFKSFSISGDQIYTGNANGVAKIDMNSHTVDKLWNYRTSAICYAGNDNLWIGTTNGLYLKHNSDINKFDLGEKFNNSIIYDIKKSKKRILIGSNSYGLGVLKNGQLQIISKNEGLLSNYIKSIHVDSKDNIWLSTNFGLNCLELNEKNQVASIKSYTTSDGLYSNDVRDCYVDYELNKVYVATSDGLNIIDLSKENNAKLAPKIHLNEILLNNSPIVKNNDAKFNSQQNNIQFNFSGISFKSLGNISFKYKLEGLEDEWIETKNNTIRYSSLPPNNYTFKVKAISKDNIESLNSVEYTFNISQPFYKKKWFLLSTLVIISLIIFNFIYSRNRRLEKERKIKENISALRYQALNAQMNPHFINNLIVNINSLTDKEKFDEVKDSLSKFAELVNLVLQSTKTSLISLNDEIAMSKLYLELQKLRFNKNIEYHINYESLTTENLKNILIPPMILQPIIENSIKHGFKSKNKKNTITINLRIENNEFVICEISDNGIGIKNSNEMNPKEIGISLKNINERLQLICEAKKKEKFVFVSNLTNEFNTLVGSKVTLKIPLISY